MGSGGSSKRTGRMRCSGHAASGAGVAAMETNSVENSGSRLSRIRKRLTYSKPNPQADPVQ